MIIRKDLSWSTIIFDKETPDEAKNVEDLLYSELAISQPGAEFSPQFRRGFWDGKVHFYETSSHRFPTGMVPKVCDILKESDLGFDYDIEDNRPDKFIKIENIPDKITLKDGDKGNITLRPDQYEAVKATFLTGMGIIHSATGSGKTEMACAIIKYTYDSLEKDERILFFTGKKRIYDQTLQRLKDRLGLPIGEFKSGKVDLKPIMVCMIPTAESYLKVDPEAKLSLSAKEGMYKKMKYTYLPKFKNSSNPRQQLRTFLKLFAPQTKADSNIKDLLEDLYASSGSDASVIKHMEQYAGLYDEAVKHKASDKYKKREFINNFLNSAVMIIADECLAKGTSIQMKDGYKYIEDLKVGDTLAGDNKVVSVSHKTSGIMAVNHEQGMLFGTITHPVAVYGMNNKVTFKALSQLRPGDALMFCTDDNGKEFYKSRVVSTGMLDGEQEVYDIETTNHTFIGGGVLQHNCHHAKSDTWYKVLMTCENAIYRIGLTGSIDKSDPVTMGRLHAVFGGIIDRFTNKQAIDKGIAAKPTIIMAPIYRPLGLSKEKDWQKIYVDGIVENDNRNKVITAFAKRYYENGSSILISVNYLAQAENISNLLEKAGVPHETLNGQQEDEQQKSELDNVKNGHTRVIIATSIMDEGIDIANMDVLIMAAGGKSLRQVLQRVGRVIRKKKTGENKATIIDFIDYQSDILLKHSKDRKRIYEEEGFKIIDDK